MPELNPPLYLSVDDAYRGWHMTLPWRGIVSEGVLGATALKVGPAVPPGMGVQVEAGRGWVEGDTDPLQQGMYHVVSSGPVTLPVEANPSGSTRTDRLVARVYDSEFAGTENKWALELLKGTPALPALPPTAVPLAEVSVAVGASQILAAQITDRRPQSAAGGQCAPFVPVREKGVASGVASLDTAAKVPVAQLPRASRAGSRRPTPPPGCSRCQLPVWGQYTPVWTVAAGASIGNGGPAGYYVQVGKLMFVRIRMLAGSRPSSGRGSGSSRYRSTAAGGRHDRSGHGRAVQAGRRLLPRFRHLAGGQLGAPVRPVARPLGGWTGADPFTWAAGDDLNFQMFYESPDA